jgi:NAD(P)-dependent dehydrogenase (short-subunit alcohol dehydrogenase family)
MQQFGISIGEKMHKYSFEDLKNKVCVITGGGGVIGSSIAESLSALGAKVVILDLKQEIADRAASSIKEKNNAELIGVEANVLDKKSLENAKNIILARYGEIDILINGAGGNSPKATTKEEFITEDTIGSLADTFFGLEIEGFEKVFDLNFMGTLLPTMVFAEIMVQKGKGVILNISSMNSFRSLTKIPAYSAAKAAINNFTEWLAVHFAKRNVRVNAIAPGFFLTNQNRFLLIDETTNELTARGNKIISNTPMAKFGEPDDLIGGTLYLISDISSFVTGIVLPIDGGFNVYSGV